ncbi:MAG: ferritin-like domain-containing protein [Polyangiaceae bacterium]
MMKLRSDARHSESKVATALRRALLVALAAPATMLVAQACGSSSSGGPTSSGPDASLGDAGDSGIEDSGPPADAGPCAPHTVYVDAQAPDGGIECGVFQLFSCGIPYSYYDGGTDAGVVTLYDDCFYSQNDCPKLCPGELFFNCHVYGKACDAGVLLQQSTDPIIVECATCPNGVGRRPRGLAPIASRASRRKNENALGNYFANAAHLEAASVHAFRILRRELLSFSAPKNLLDAAKRAEHDEVRHARVTARIARAHGSKPPKVRVKRTAARSLEAIATENAVEGCVRETFGALVAMWQAERATDSDVASAMKTIAVDETKHAQLAWNVAAWAEKRLDAKSRKRVNAAKTKAIRDLEKEITIDADPDLIARAGLPSAAEQRRLLAALSENLFGADFET